MPLYCQFTKLTEQGRTTDRSGAASKEVNKGPNEVLAAHGVKTLHVYALMGPWDFVNILDAPSHEAITAMTVEINALGMVETMTMPATEISDLKAIVSGK